ncbi:MAG: hypothetical protein ACM3ST_11440 [Bdellovibrio bacteriovorus]
MMELNDQVFVFTGAAFEAALVDWVEAQVAAYPHQEERIRITAAAMRDFLLSDAARRHKLLMSKPPLGRK